jgi:hypothetical protein
MNHAIESFCIWCREAAELLDAAQPQSPPDPQLQEN